MTSGRRPRDYPPEVVESVLNLYESGLTIREVQALTAGYRVQTILERHLPERRKAIKRNQRGPANHSWKGDAPGYQAAHLRAESIKGKASSHLCADCGEAALDWSYTHGCPSEMRGGNGLPYCPHPDHYVPRCRSCHRQFDRQAVAHA